jgi:hypothetical protein
MKFTPVLIACALLALLGPSIAKAQTKSSTPPPPPPLAKTLKSEAKGRKAIPPPPPLSSIRSPRKKRSTSVARSNPLHSPGTDPTGRMDLEGKNVAFYPIVKGDVVKPNMQQSALKAGAGRGKGGGVNPAPPKAETYK